MMVEEFGEALEPYSKPTFSKREQIARPHQLVGGICPKNLTYFLNAAEVSKAVKKRKNGNACLGFDGILEQARNH